MTKLLTTVTLAALVLFGSQASAEQLVGIGAPYWSGRLAATTTSQCVKTSSASGAACELFPAGDGGSWAYRYVNITTSAAARCCFSMDQSAAAGAFGITDSVGTNGSGPGQCVSLPGAGSVRFIRPSASDMRSMPGGRAGTCSGLSPNNKSQEALYPACDSTAHCTAYSSGGGTCTAIGSVTELQRQAVGVYLLCVADSTANVDITKESVRR